MTTPSRISLWVLGALILLPTGVQAQRISTWAGTADLVHRTSGGEIRQRIWLESSLGETPAITPQAMATGPRSGVTLAFGGLVGGVLGFFAGGLSGVAVCDCNSGEGYDALEAFFLGAAVGTAITIPLGVHLANRSDGNYGISLAASAGISALGLAAAFAADEAAIVLLVPISQIVSSVLIERRTTR